MARDGNNKYPFARADGDFGRTPSQALFESAKDFALRGFWADTNARRASSMAGSDQRAPSMTPQHKAGDAPRLLACSAMSNQERLQAQLLSGRGPGGASASGGGGAMVGSASLSVYRRRGLFEHYQPKPLMTSTMRVVTQQSALIMSNYMTDQMDEDNKRNERVENGEISQIEADELSQEWEQEEWKKRWAVFPKQLFNAFVKYHVVTLFMRCYEYSAEWILKYDNDQMVKLTRDMFVHSKTIASTHKGETGKIMNQTFTDNMWANVVAYIADYSVHQILLCFGYYVYIRNRQKQLREASPRSKEDDADAEIRPSVVDGPLFLSFVNKSSRLATTRVLGCVFYSMGAAFGTVMFPGWGTLFLANMGEGFSTVILEETGAVPKA